MKQILTICVLTFFTSIFSQNSQLVEIETNDGNIFLGTIIEENEDSAEEIEEVVELDELSLRLEGISDPFERKLIELEYRREKRSNRRR